MKGFILDFPKSPKFSMFLTIFMEFIMNFSKTDLKMRRRKMMKICLANDINYRTLF